jgi:DNA-3-methyladenine glycosylase
MGIQFETVMYSQIPMSFYERPAVVVAQELLGCRLIVEHPGQEAIGGLIVETEAYTTNDPACHAWHLEQKRKTNPNASGKGEELFGAPGFTYIYLNYGMYWLLNVVTDPIGTPGAVLIRAVEPCIGEEQFWKNRPKVKKREDLANGPGKLTLAMGIDQRYHQISLAEGPLRLQQPRHRRVEVATSGRIGISQGVDLPWRFFIKDSNFVSRAKPSLT